MEVQGAELSVVAAAEEEEVEMDTEAALMLVQQGA